MSEAVMRAGLLKRAGKALHLGKADPGGFVAHDMHTGARGLCGDVDMRMVGGDDRDQLRP